MSEEEDKNKVQEKPMDGRKLTDPRAWAQETFGAAQLGDPRRTKRLVRVAGQMAADPQGSLPREMGGDWAALKAAYRLLRADGVTHEAISRPFWQQTREPGGAGARSGTGGA